MTIAKDFVAKASVALVAAAMIFTMFAPSAKAQSSEDLQKMINDLLAQIAALQSQVGQGSSSAAGVCPYTWTRDLSQGATGADVMKLQQFLNANADTRVAATGAGSVGMETEYYGPATAAAVSKFQVMYRAEVLVGLVNPTGYFGPASRAKANALCVAAPVVVPPTDGGNGTSTDGGDSATLEGGAGSITVTDTTSDVEDDVNTGSSENVLGFKVEAEGSDVSVTNVKVTVNAGSGAGSNRLERYFDSFDVVLDGEVVGSMDAADFNRDSSGKYSSNVALKNAIVREDDKLTFYVVAHAVNSLDSANTYTWTVDVTSIRYTDAEGAILTDNTNITANTGVNVVKLSSSTDVKVKVSLDASNPVAQAVKVSDDNSGDLVTLLTFKVKAEGTDIDFDQVKFELSVTKASSTEMVSEYRLMRGSDLVQTADDGDVVTGVATSTLTMSLDDSEMVDQDETVTYSLVAKMNKNTFIGNSMSASVLKAADINANDANGDAIATSRFSGSAIGSAQTFRADGLFADSKTVTATKLQTGTPSKDYAEFKFVMDMTADGDDYYFASTSAPFTYSIVNGAGSVLVGSSSATLSSDATKTAGGDYVIYDGQTKSVTFIVTMLPGVPATSYKAIASAFDFGSSASSLTDQAAVSLTPASDFTSDPVTIVQ